MRARGSNRGGLRAGGRWLVAALAACLALPGQAGRRAERTPLDEWAEGPVRYLITREEARRFRSLENVTEQTKFVRYFWERRDPDPRSPQNELRLAFWSRVAEANRRFGDTPKPGWKTDRGKIFILLGPPDDVEKDENYDTEIRTASARGLLRWIYHGLRQASTSAVTVVAFLQQGDGDWRLTDDYRFSRATFDMNRPLSEGTYGQVDRMMQNVTWAGSNLSIAMDLARLQEVPTERDLLRAAVRSEQFLDTIPGAAATHTVTSQGRQLLAVTLAVPRVALTPAWDGSATGLVHRFAALAQLRPRDPGAGPPIEVAEQDFIPEPAPVAGDRYLRFQALCPVPPGHWQLSGVVFDRQSANSASVLREFDVPAPEASLEIDGPLLVTAVLPSGEPERPGPPAAFRSGGLLLVPQPPDEVRIDEPVRLFVRARHASAVAAEWSVAAASSTAVALKSGRIEDARAGTPIEIAAGELPPGEYVARFRLAVQDGPAVERQLRFSVTARAASGG
ncbi:MAG: GWxTD domain-containing protein [Acidobacteria bacterium]|nr:GWxTD domain-containing protein [Acidobacteriota bacterium]